MSAPTDWAPAWSMTCSCTHTDDEVTPNRQAVPVPTGDAARVRQGPEALWSYNLCSRLPTKQVCMSDYHLVSMWGRLLSSAQ